MPGYFVPNVSAIEFFINQANSPLAKKMNFLAEETRKNAITLAQQDLGKIPGDAPRTGILKRSFRTQKNGGPSYWKVQNTASYFGPIELGARPHVIRATGLSARRVQRQQASLASRGQPKTSSGLKNSLYKRPKTNSGPFLQFQARDGRWVKVKQVNHPGNKPYRVLSRALYYAALGNLANVRKLGGSTIT